MSAKSVVSKIDWAKTISNLGLTGSTASSLLAFKKRNDEARKKLYDATSQSTEVNFEHYRSVLKNQAIVDEIEKAYKSFKPVTYDVSKQITAIEAYESKAMQNAKDTEAKVNLELKDLQATLDNIEAARPFEQLTLEDLAKARPDVEAKVRELVAKGRWDVPGYEDKFGNFTLM